MMSPEDRSPTSPSPAPPPSRITCPVTGRLEEIAFEVDPEDGRVLEVRSCSAFSPPELVRCDQLCVQRLNQRNLVRRLCDRAEE